jgi:N-acetylated-alpha-linked acidic dipeptidase
MRPPSAIQRGSVQFLSIGPGDPSTPGAPSIAGAKRLTRDQMQTVPKIPSLPISYGEAEKILRRLGGPRVPDEWQGGLPFSYHVGPGAAAVAMDVQMDEGLKPIYNVVARIKGSVEPEKLVVLGNHRDAWTHGAVDPNSGTAAMLEMARGFGAALKGGWTPKRTIVLASWDAEEYGLVGSTEWAEEHAADLQKNAVAYLNCDVAVTGPNLGLNGVPSLRELALQAAKDVPEPKRGGSIGTAWESAQRSAWAQRTPVELNGKDATFQPRLQPLGSGSDYTAFLDNLGVPSFDFGFGGPYGVYHAVYDNFRWMELYGDPGFLYHAAAARLWGLMAMRLASADVVPLRFSSYAKDLQDDLDALRRDAIRRARTNDPASGQKPAITPDFSEIIAALQELGAAGAAADKTADAVAASGDAARAKALNDTLIQVERAFLSPEGLPKRPWFRHMLIAPGLTTGYAAWPFPALQEAIEERDAAMFSAEAKRVVAAIKAGTEKLKSVTK